MMKSKPTRQNIQARARRKGTLILLLATCLYCPLTANADSSGEAITADQAYHDLKELRVEQRRNRRVRNGMYIPYKYVTLALFNDGTYTEHLNTLREIGKDRSQRDKPEFWGEWMASGDDVLLKSPKSSQFKEPMSTWVARAGEPGQTLNRCYSKLSSSSAFAGASEVHSIKQLCFSPDGTFSNSSSTSVSVLEIEGFENTPKQPTLVGATNRTEQNNRYSLDGNIIHFVKANGARWWSTFSFMSNSDSVILLDGASWTEG